MRAFGEIREQFPNRSKNGLNEPGKEIGVMVRRWGWGEGSRVGQSLPVGAEREQPRQSHQLARIGAKRRRARSGFKAVSHQVSKIK